MKSTVQAPKPRASDVGRAPSDANVRGPRGDKPIARRAHGASVTRTLDDPVYSEARYRGLLEAAPDAMVVVDQDGHIVLLNLQTEKQFGYRRDELLGQGVTNIIPQGFAERLIADDLRSAADALAQQIGSGIELVARRKDGTEFPIEIMLSPFRTSQGILVTVAIRDITARRLAEGQLLQAQKLESVGRLAAGIAHDFNNMLFAIQGYAEFLATDLAEANRSQFDPDHALQSVLSISDAADRAALLTAQLLAFSRQQMVDPKVLSLNDRVLGLERLVRQLIGGNMRLVLELDRAAGNVRADPGQLDQILVNLLVNARDAMPSGGTVTIRTENVVVAVAQAMQHLDAQPGRFVRLEVADTGVGIDRAAQQHIFEPFFTTKEVGKGTGLGLATTYGIVRQAGGHIWLDSEPGHGTSFKLHFPRVDVPAARKDVVDAVAAAPGGGCVLVVEDDPVVRDLTSQMLTRAGYSVEAVADIATGLGRLRDAKRSFDVVVSDVIMPNMSGIQLADLVMDRHPGVGVVLLSGFMAQTPELKRVVARGALFVPKPIKSGQLAAAVRQVASAVRTPDPTQSSRVIP